MMKLRDNPVFKEDYKRYQQQILEITDERLKVELTDLLLMLSREVSAIDMHHETLLINGRMPNSLSDSRSSLASIKKKLDAKLAAAGKKS
jgi:hypothetical protein